MAEVDSEIAKALLELAQKDARGLEAQKKKRDALLDGEESRSAVSSRPTPAPVDGFSFKPAKVR